jgi:hypothetical protein
MNINLQNIETLYPRVQGYLPQEYKSIMQSSYTLFQKAINETQENEQEKEAKEYFVSLFIAKLNEVLAGVDYSNLPPQEKKIIRTQVQNLIDRLKSFQFEATQVAGSFSLNGIPQTKIVGKYSLNGLGGIEDNKKDAWRISSEEYAQNRKFLEKTMGWGGITYHNGILKSMGMPHSYYDLAIARNPKTAYEYAKKAHPVLVFQALMKGEKVPEKVLHEYPQMEIAIKLKKLKF